jgi:Fur family peroxide stress response transcriptional regulator
MTSDKDTMQTELFRKRCREHHLKMTPQRLAVFRQLAGSRDHPSADAVYRKVRKVMPDISFDTVNRTLLTFSRIGVANVVEGYGEPKRFDPDTHGHHHFRCTQCGAIIDFDNRAWDRLRVPEGIRRQHTVMNTRVVLEGVCRQCKE